jgi:hypothetical protein
MPGGAPRHGRVGEAMREAMWVGLLAFISICLVGNTIWENGDIQVKWWAVRAWADFQFPDVRVDQHTLRWGMNLPVVLFVAAFGGGPLSYLLLHHLLFALTTAGLYALIRKFTTPLVATAAFAVWMVHPVGYDLSANMMPELYSLAYLVGALLLLCKAYESGSKWVYAAAIAVLLIAYGVKETNLFLMPGLGLYELMRRRWANVAIIVGVFAAGFLVETLAVNAILADSDLLLGRVQAILQSRHVTWMTSVPYYESTDLLTRWLFLGRTNLDRLEYFSKILYWIFFLLSAWKAWQWARARTLLPPSTLLGPDPGAKGDALAATWAIGLSFAFFTTFFIISLNPLRLGQPPLDRYLWPMLAPTYIVLSVALKFALDRAANGRGMLLSALDRARRALEPLSAGRAGLATLTLIAALGTLTHWAIELGTIHIRRHGYDQPYTLFTAERYYADLRQRLLQGCTLVFTRTRPAHVILIHAFPHSALRPSERMVVMSDSLDGLSVEGRQLRVWPLPRAEWDAFAGKLHFEPTLPNFQPYALRLDGGGRCDRTYYVGNGDIHPRDQPVDSNIAGPPDVPETQP